MKTSTAREPGFCILYVNADGPCIFTQQDCTHHGLDFLLWMTRSAPPLKQLAAVCDTAAKLALPEGVLVTASTWYYDGGGC